jgi:ubiquinone/menaquinone biosynthesis C-methylase UbiE
VRICRAAIGQALRTSGRQRRLTVERWLERLYLAVDPWNLSGEQDRFRQTNALIRRHLPPIDSVLELGCGEGHQSEHLQQVCCELHGVDLSPVALARARRRVPGATFSWAAVETGEGLPARRFDLVTACEVLYYIEDVPAVLARLVALGRFVLVSYYRPRAPQVEPHLRTVPGIQFDRIVCGSKEWIVAWWSAA